MWPRNSLQGRSHMYHVEGRRFWCFYCKSGHTELFHSSVPKLLLLFVFIFILPGSISSKTENLGQRHVIPRLLTKGSQLSWARRSGSLGSQFSCRVGISARLPRWMPICFNPSANQQLLNSSIPACFKQLKAFPFSATQSWPVGSGKEQARV